MSCSILVNSHINGVVHTGGDSTHEAVLRNRATWSRLLALGGVEWMTNGGRALGRRLFIVCGSIACTTQQPLAMPTEQPALAPRPSPQLTANPQPPLLQQRHSLLVLIQTHYQGFKSLQVETPKYLL